MATGKYPGVSVAEKRAMLEAAGEPWPTCNCHGEPKRWNSDTRLRSGGIWRESNPDKVRAGKRQQRKTPGTWEYDAAHGIGIPGAKRRDKDRRLRSTPGSYRYQYMYGIGEPGKLREKNRYSEYRRNLRNRIAQKKARIAELTEELKSYS